MSSIWAWAAWRVASGLLVGGAEAPAKVRERSVPHFGQQGMALSRGGGRMGVVRVIVDDILIVSVCWMGWKKALPQETRK